jgi:hypothetical protein
VRCGICGNENAESSYYCGMCGAALTGKTQHTAQSPAQPAVGQRQPAAPQKPVSPPQPVVPQQPPQQRAPQQPVQSPRIEMPESRRSQADRPSDQHAAPVITGPSFLGLNTPPAERREPEGRDSFNRDAHAHEHLEHSSKNLDYLLEDEEERKGGWGKLILVVIALALAVGFGYLRWKQGGFDWLTAGDKKPAASTPAAQATPGSSADSSGANGPAAPGADPSGAPLPTATPEQSPSASAADSGTPATPAPGGATTTPVDSAAPPNNPQQTAPSTTPAKSVSTPKPPADSNPAADSESPPGSQPADSDSNVQPAPAAAPVAKPRERKPTPVRPLDPVTEGERYIYGRGVRQDCDRGMRLLKPAATEQSNAKAMISLGALYSTGTCTPRDLPTAYRWFALALHKEPDNQPLQDDLQKLWSQMTQPERQLAIKLSQ